MVFALSQYEQANGLARLQSQATTFSGKIWNDPLPHKTGVIVLNLKQLLTQHKVKAKAEHLLLSPFGTAG
jgi:hypothetical protein